MEEQLINLETAKLAKEKGFDIQTKNWYDQLGVLNPMKGARGSMVYENVGYAPTQSLLQKWLREVHNIHLIVINIQNSNHYEMSIIKQPGHEFHHIDQRLPYEEMLEIALQKSLNLI